MYQHPHKFVAGGSSSSSSSRQPWNCLELIHEIKDRVQKCSGLEAKPTISSSRPMGPPALKGTSSSSSSSCKYAPFYIVPPGFAGTRRALLIGVVTGGYEGEEPLLGPSNDISNMYAFLTNHCGFAPKDVVVLRDDKTNQKELPTKHNILQGFANLVQKSKPGDLTFIQYSGHGGKLGDKLCIFPCDFDTNGHIFEDAILTDLIKYMPAKTHTTMLVDCCYSGCVGDLPYVLHSSTQNGQHQDIETYYDTDTRQEMIERQTSNSNEYKQEKQARNQVRHMAHAMYTIATNTHKGVMQFVFLLFAF